MRHWHDRRNREVPRAALEGALATVAERSGVLGVELVDVAGDVDGVAGEIARQADTIAALAAASVHVGSSADVVRGEADQVRSSARDAVRRVAASREQVHLALGGVEGLADWVGRLAAELEEVTGSLQSVSAAAQAIDVITRQTHILALNARIEAARSGEAGLGFAVIADSVRQLAEQTGVAARQVTETVAALAGPLTRLQEDGRTAGRQATTVRAGALAVVEVLGDVDTALTRVDGSAHQIADRAQQTRAQVAETSHGLEALAVGVAASRDLLAQAGGRVTSLLAMSEALLQTTAACGVTTEDSPFVGAVQAVAAEVERRFAAELSAGRCSPADLFDERYTPVPGSDPPQLLTRFTALTDRLLADLQEEVLRLDPRVVFCAAVDRNGYLPTHNAAFSRPQGPDPAWNAAHCRNRRLFDDRTGTAAARSRAPFLLQTYRRDMGGGSFALMKDVSAPVLVDGRHWGAVRLAYRARAAAQA